MTGLQLEGNATIDGTAVFDGVSLPVENGRWTCLLGRSGVGKSTIMRLVAGRLYLYALAAAGQAGVERALEKYKSELTRDMKLMGCTKISDLNRSNLRFRT